ncbi:unnamed protein product, partial [Toxocara canis]|uniref:ABC transporter domain-containing protein n=1 Tax=Toxocara canis TaxID=6265 RepID=A0A183VH50_TOXCA
MMKSSFAHIPRLLVDAMRAIVSLQRIAQLLYSEELHEYREGVRQKSKDEIAVCFSDATLTWDSALSRDHNVHLHRLNMTIKQGELVAVVGKVSSGKSSLLSAILGEMTLISGNVTVNGRISYSAQEPWI